MEEGFSNGEAVAGVAGLESRAKKAKAKHAEGRAAASATLLASIKERIVKQMEEAPVGSESIRVIVNEMDARTPILKWLVNMDFRVERVTDEDGDPYQNAWNVFFENK